MLPALLHGTAIIPWTPEPAGEPEFCFSGAHPCLSKTSLGWIPTSQRFLAAAAPKPDTDGTRRAQTDVTSTKVTQEIQSKAGNRSWQFQNPGQHAGSPFPQTELSWHYHHHNNNANKNIIKKSSITGKKPPPENICTQHPWAAPLLFSIPSAFSTNLQLGPANIHSWMHPSWAGQTLWEHLECHQPWPPFLVAFCHPVPLQVLLPGQGMSVAAAAAFAEPALSRRAVILTFLDHKMSQSRNNSNSAEELFFFPRIAHLYRNKVYQQKLSPE